MAQSTFSLDPLLAYPLGPYQVCKLCRCIAPEKFCCSPSCQLFGPLCWVDKSKTESDTHAMEMLPSFYGSYPLPIPNGVQKSHQIAMWAGNKGDEKQRQSYNVVHFSSISMGQEFPAARQLINLRHRLTCPPSVRDRKPACEHI